MHRALVLVNRARRSWTTYARSANSRTPASTLRRREEVVEVAHIPHSETRTRSTQAP